MKFSVVIPAVIGILLIVVSWLKLKKKPSFNHLGNLFLTGGVDLWWDGTYVLWIYRKVYFD